MWQRIYWQNLSGQPYSMHGMTYTTLYFLRLMARNGSKFVKLRIAIGKSQRKRTSFTKLPACIFMFFLPFLDQPGDNFKVNFYNCTTKWLLYFLKQLIFVIYITCLQVYRYFILIVQRYKESVFENKMTYLESIKLGARKNIQMQKGKEECSE